MQIAQGRGQQARDVAHHVDVFELRVLEHGPDVGRAHGRDIAIAFLDPRKGIVDGAHLAPGLLVEPVDHAAIEKSRLAQPGHARIEQFPPLVKHLLFVDDPPRLRISRRRCSAHVHAQQRDVSGAVTGPAPHQIDVGQRY